METSRKSLELAYCATFASLIAALSWISIPSAVPFTMQTFGVFFTLLTLGGKRGTTSILVYLLLGSIGAPVFAGFSGGIGQIFGATGGYLLGFIAIGVVYTLAIKDPMVKPVYHCTALVIGLLLCYLLGTLQFVFVYNRSAEAIGLMTALSWCVFPYVVPDLVKLGLAYSLSTRLKGLLKL